MPQTTTGGSKPRPKKNTGPKVLPATDTSVGGNDFTPPAPAGSSGTSANTNPRPVPNKNSKARGGAGGGSEPGKADTIKPTGSFDASQHGGDSSGGGGGGHRPGTQQDNADRFGFNYNAPPVVRNTGGTVSPPDRTGPRISPVAREGGGNLGLPGHGDPDLVGSQNTIDHFDGSSGDYGSSNSVEDTTPAGGGGGGGTGSGLAGRESVSNVGSLDNTSIEEVVYGVKKKGKKSIRRGLGE